MSGERNNIQEKKTAGLAIHLLETVAIAIIYGLFSFFVIYRHLAGGIALHAYLWNIAFIFVVLVTEKITGHLLASAYFHTAKKRHKIMLAKLQLLNALSFKASLYLYYIFVLLATRIAVLEPTLIDEGLRTYLLSVEFCVLLLIPVDKFLEQLMKDEKRMNRIYSRIDRIKRKSSDAPTTAPSKGRIILPPAAAPAKAFSIKPNSSNCQIQPNTLNVAEIRKSKKKETAYF